VADAGARIAALNALRGSGLDLAAALRETRRNDLLPPRTVDRFAGQVRAGFVEDLKAAIADGGYRPVAADVVLVPKPRFASRPAALLGFADRVVYQALVSLAAEKIERVLDDPANVMWPRGGPTPKRWREFLTAPLASDPTHVVVADVAGFYESVDHGRLRRMLVLATGNTPLGEAVVSFLGEVMGSGRGLPQGLEASDHLATLYLAEADAAIGRAGLQLFRHGDDLRVPVHGYDEGLRAANVVEQALRRCGLLTNGSKLAVELAGRYRDELGDRDVESERLRAAFAEARRKAEKRTDDEDEDPQSPLGLLAEDADDEDEDPQSPLGLLAEDADDDG